MAATIVVVKVYSGSQNSGGAVTSVWMDIMAVVFTSKAIVLVASQAVRLPGIPKVARSRLTECSKSCDLQPHCIVQYVKLREYCPVQGEGCDQSIGSTVSDAIVRSWLWSTATI